MKRRGFTLIEMLLSTAVTAVLAASLATLFLGVRRLVRQAYTDADLSLALRAEREKALFNAVTEGGMVYWGGLLSGKDSKVESTRSVEFKAVGIQPESGYPLDRNHQKWQRADVGHVERLGGKTQLYSLTMERTSGDETRTARVIVPVFGMEQNPKACNVFSEGTDK